MKRRHFLAAGALASLSLLSGCTGASETRASNPQDSGADTAPEELTPISRGSLTIPPLLDPAPVDGVKHFHLTIREGTHSFFEGTSSPTYGVDADYLGPTLLLRSGEEVSIDFTNTLPEATTMHGHGMHVPAAMDGGPHQIIPPQGRWSARYRVAQKACTNWYHPHLMGKTAEHVYKGLAGFIIVEDEQSAALDLPKTYGEDDIPLVVQDRRFDSRGEILYAPSMMDVMRGYHGNTYLVNGGIEPDFHAKSGLLRIRLLNGSNAGLYSFGFSDLRTFHTIATDNALLEQPVAMDRIFLSPGERAEIVVDLSADGGKSVLLKEFNADKTILKIDVSDVPARVRTLPTTLTTLERPDPTTAIRTRTFRLSGRMGRFFINGASMDMDVINETVPVDQTEIWEVINEMGMPHNFHIHATHFLLLERDGSAANVAEHERGYKDVVFLGPNARVKLLVRMRDYTDSVHPYMYHCHFLEHEDAGMMGQFTVV